MFFDVTLRRALVDIPGQEFRQYSFIGSQNEELRGRYGVFDRPRDRNRLFTRPARDEQDVARFENLAPLHIPQADAKKRTFQESGVRRDVADLNHTIFPRRVRFDPLAKEIAGTNCGDFIKIKHREDKALRKSIEKKY